MPDQSLPNEVEAIECPECKGRCIALSDLPKIEAAAVERERERLRKVLPRLLDSYTADVIRHVEGVPGAGNDRAKSQGQILAAIDQEASDE